MADVDARALMSAKEGRNYLGQENWKDEAGRNGSVVLKCGVASAGVLLE